MTLPKLGFTLVLGSVVVIACGSDDSDADANVSPETACRDAATAVCDKLQECAPFLLEAGFADRATCIDRFEINCASSFTANGTSATPARMSRCAAEARTATCEAAVGRMLPESCRVAAGKLPDGSPCGQSEQCQNRLCRVPAGSTCGACSAPGAAGAACERDADCEDGLTCAGEKCVAFGRLGDTCSGTAPCLPTLACISGACVTPLGAGAPCKFDVAENPCDVARGLYCHPRTNVCSQVTTSPPGGPCEVSLEAIVGCSRGHCKRPAGSTKGTCEAFAADGASCDDEDGPKCLPPARCRNRVCTIPDPASCR